MKLALSILFLATATYGQGTLLWDESVNGPLSNDPFAPTSLGSLQSNTNSIMGSAHFFPADGGPGGTLISDFVTFTIGNGALASKLWLTADNSVSVWIGNTAFSETFGSIINPANGELFAQLSLENLPSGSYGLYVSDRAFGSAPTIANYRLDFFVEPVPEPSTISFALLGLGALALRHRKSQERLR